MGDPISHGILIERIRYEVYLRDHPGTNHIKEEMMVFDVQHPSHSPAHGAREGGSPVIHTERITCIAGDLTNLIAYLAQLLPPMEAGSYRYRYPGYDTAR